MGSRINLHNELLTFLPKVYFQPPSSLQMVYPCIVYNKSSKTNEKANDRNYMSVQGYQLMIIEKNPDSDIADRIENHFQHCVIAQYYTVDNLHHTTLNLYY